MPHHPWRTFRDLTEWTLRWEPLAEGVWGETCFDSQTVTLTLGMNQAERRCTIAHETEHILRGPPPAGLEAWEDELVDRRVSRLLLPDTRDVGEALAWSRGGIHEAAHELWVDEFILQSRLRYLLPSERDLLQRRLSDVDPGA